MRVRFGYEEHISMLNVTEVVADEDKAKEVEGLKLLQIDGTCSTIIMIETQNRYKLLDMNARTLSQPDSHFSVLSS